MEEVKRCAEFIATLEPKPGRRFSAESPAYVLPEVELRKIEGVYKIMLNDDQIPHLRISQHYKSLMENPDTGKEVKTYIRDKVRAGAFLIKSISQRPNHYS